MSCSVPGAAKDCPQNMRYELRERDRADGMNQIIPSLSHEVCISISQGGVIMDNNVGAPLSNDVPSVQQSHTKVAFLRSMEQKFSVPAQFEEYITSNSSRCTYV